MTKKARTGKLYSEVEGEMLMENVPDDRMTKENNENEEKMTEIEDIRASHDLDAIMTDDKDEEIVFEQEHSTNTSTESDLKDTSPSSSSSDSTSSSDNESDSEVICTKVVQGEKYEKPDGWSSDDDVMEVQPKVTEPKATNENTAEDKQGKADAAFFIKVTNRNNKKKQTKKQKIIAATTNADRMERANRLLQSTGHESDYEDKSKGDPGTHQSKYKTGKTMATVPKLPKTMT
jgi:hypothetical protein